MAFASQVQILFSSFLVVFFFFGGVMKSPHGFLEAHRRAADLRRARPSPSSTPAPRHPPSCAPSRAASARREICSGTRRQPAARARRPTPVRRGSSSGSERPREMLRQPKLRSGSGVMPRSLSQRPMPDACRETCSQLCGALCALALAAFAALAACLARREALCTAPRA